MNLIYVILVRILFAISYVAIAVWCLLAAVAILVLSCLVSVATFPALIGTWLEKWIDRSP